MIDPTKIIDQVTGAIDDNYLSEQESEDIRTERQRIDVQSDNPMAKIIRPVITLLTGVVWAFAMVFSFFKTAPTEVVYSISAVFTMCIGFYFHSRRQEKIAARKSDAAIKIEKLKTRHELREERRDNRQERKK